MEKKRIRIQWSRDRVKAFCQGKSVFMTQDGQPYEQVPPPKYCCAWMRNMMKTEEGRKVIAQCPSRCPNCGQPLPDKESTAKTIKVAPGTGMTRTKIDIGNGKRKWSPWRAKGTPFIMPLDGAPPLRLRLW